MRKIIQIILHLLIGIIGMAMGLTILTIANQTDNPKLIGFGAILMMMSGMFLEKLNPKHWSVKK